MQVGARQHAELPFARALGEISKPVLVKRGMSATIEELLLSAGSTSCRAEITM